MGKDAHPTAFLFQKLGFAGVSFIQPYRAVDGWEAHPTAFLFQKLGFAGVSFCVGFCRSFCLQATQTYEICNRCQFCMGFFWFI
ncbi:MAG: hypothetical protein IK065_05635 [Neisseriaceae bacterium]|nr:hypothetical protein [Neisseriaceae bacterium]